MTSKRSFIGAAAIVIVLALWLLSGMLESNDPQADAATTTPIEQKMTSVRAEIMASTLYTSDVIIRGRTQAIRTVHLRSQIDAQIVELPVEKGQMVKKGDVICRLSVDDRQARLDEAEAFARQRELEANAARRLAERGHRSATQTAAAIAQYDAAQAQVKRIKVELANTAIRASFDGVVNDRPVEVGAYLQAGDVCAVLVEEDPFLFVGDVTEQDVAALNVGDEGMVRLATGQVVPGTVRFISAVANDTTRTFPIEMVIGNPDRVIRGGITAVAEVPVKDVTAHLLSPAVLTLDDDGTVGVRTLDANDSVLFKPVNIVGDTAEGIWVTGLDSQEAVITVGHEFVKAGEKVLVDLITSPGTATATRPATGQEGGS